MVQKYIRAFSAVSVRERSSVEQLGKLYDNEIAYVCDPVLLNPAEDYDAVRADRMIKEPYILVYVAQDIEPSVLNNWINKANGETRLFSSAHIDKSVSVTTIFVNFHRENF